MSDTVPAEATGPTKEIEKYFAAAVKLNASDIHLKVGEPVLFRVKGTISRTKQPPLTNAQIVKMVEEIMTDRERDELQRLGGCDFAYAVKGSGRFRVNIFHSRQKFAIVFKFAESTNLFAVAAQGQAGENAERPEERARQAPAQCLSEILHRFFGLDVD